MTTLNLLAFNAEEIKENLFPSEVFKLFGVIPVDNSMISGSIVVVALIIVAILLNVFVINKKNEKAPGAVGQFLEWIVATFDGMSKDLTGKLSVFLGPYTFGAAAYICFGVLIEMFGFRPALADINACIALASCTFLLINLLAVKEKGIGGRIKYYFKPVALAAPIRMLTDCAVPVSMTFRLFGSILSGMLMMDVVYAVIPWVLPAALSVLFTVFHALIQSYVFAALSLTFIGEATE